MPNNAREDYVPVHKHAAVDINGLGSLFPPTQVVVGTGADPTTNSLIYIDLLNMELTFTPPSTFPLWQCRVTFQGQFEQDTDAETLSVRLTRDGTEIPATVRQGIAIGVNGPMALSSEAVIVVRGGTEIVLATQWGVGGGIGTAVGTDRRMEATLTPYNPAAM